MTLPDSVLVTLPDHTSEVILQTVLKSNLAVGRSEMTAYIQAYKALEEAGYSNEDGIWVSKDAPTVGDVHVNRPIGSIQYGRKKPKRKDDPGTEDVSTEGNSRDLSTSLPETNSSDFVKENTVTFDVPLFIRLLEVAREEIKTDEPLHEMAERIIALSSKDKTLRMDDYNSIVSVLKKEQDEEKDDPGTQDVDVPTMDDSEFTPPHMGVEFTDPKLGKTVKKRISGNSPIPLSGKGRILARSLGQAIKMKGGLDVVYSSPLTRGRETAQAIVDADPNCKLGDPLSALQPWHLGDIEGKEPKDVKDLIKHYIEHPDEVPPGKGLDGRIAESFNAAKNRQLDCFATKYNEAEEHPNLKLGIITHSRGQALLQAWVDLDCPDDYDLKDSAITDPDDPDHADVLRWHKDKIKPIDLEDEDELKPGVYCILHSLTADDTDTGNPELKKGGPGSGPHPSQGTSRSSSNAAKESHEALLAEHDQLKEHPGRTSDTPSHAAEQSYRNGLHDLKQHIEDHGKKYGMPQSAKTHMAQATYNLYSGTAVGRESSLMSMHNAIRAIGHVGKSEGEGQEVIQTDRKYLPPLEVHRACKAAYEAGTSVIGVTAPLAEQEGIAVAEICKIADHFVSVESETESELSRNAWGGPLALKWATRVIRKSSEDVVKDDGDSWVTINGNRVLLGADGIPKGGHPLGGGAKVEFKPSEKMQRALKAYVPCNTEQQRAADKQEEIVSKALGIPRTKNNSAFDLRNDDVGVELKTMMSGKNDKVTMNKEALGRKMAEKEAEGLKTFTVVADTRSGRTQYYYSPKLGSLRLGSMTKATLSELRSVVRGAI